MSIIPVGIPFEIKGKPPVEPGVTEVEPGGTEAEPGVTEVEPGGTVMTPNFGKFQNRPNFDSSQCGGPNVPAVTHMSIKSPLRTMRNLKVIPATIPAAFVTSFDI